MESASAKLTQLAFEWNTKKFINSEEAYVQLNGARITPANHSQAFNCSRGAS